MRRRILLVGSTSNNTYLTFIARTSGTFKHSAYDVLYSLDNGATWTSLTKNTNSPTVAAGNKIMWKASITPTNSNGTGTFSSTGLFDVEGNAMSLIYEDNYAEQTSLSGKNYALASLFYNCTTLVSAENLLLPATTLSDECYENMFRGCTSLTKAPALPATTLTQYCYMQMFYGCTSLTSAPSLPATTLDYKCYNAMFMNCTGLTKAPSLPATTLASSCYTAMFQGCTGLTNAPDIYATTLASNCCERMFKDCTNMTSGPTLRATTLPTYCYYYMFDRCSSLRFVGCLATDRSALDCTTYWMLGVTSGGTLYLKSGVNWPSQSSSGIPNGWTVTYV